MKITIITKKKHSEETRNKISQSNIGKKAWNKGKKNIYSETHLENLAKIRRERFSGENHPNFIIIEREKLVKILNENSLRKTAKIFNVSVGCIQNKIKLFNIK